jgi:hypothetical protein
MDILSKSHTCTPWVVKVTTTKDINIMERRASAKDTGGYP